jgi:hypothetical protein
MTREPFVSLVVVRVSGIEKRNQNVNVEEGRSHPSSRNRLTRERSGFAAPGSGVNKGTPFRIADVSRGSRAFLTS